MGDAEAAQQRAEAAAILGEVDGVDWGPQKPYPGVFESLRQAKGGLATELDDHALGLLDLDDGEHVLSRQRLEVEPVGGVVVRGDRLGIAVIITASRPDSRTVIAACTQQ